MSRPVVQLPAKVANQIAAGEVVARPASVVKELVENALDAGATRVVVSIEGGGAQRITVVDDGHGMSEADARLALLRHATSKIRQVDDLTAIETFGFRGEALPSIASVSRLTLRTRAAGEEAGVELKVVGGGPPEVAPCGTAPGTTVDVGDLFFNVPARKKFLRATSTESAHVTGVVREIALSRPDVQIELVRDGRRKLRWLSAPSRAERVAAVLGDDALIVAQGERGPVVVDAYLSSADRARTGAGGLHLFVCGRPVRDRALARAVAAAYGDQLDKGRYPVGALFISMPLDLVDVNVHPQKAEVRFAHARAVTDAVYSVVSRAIHTDTTVVPASSSNSPSKTSPAKSWTTPRDTAVEPWTWSAEPSMPSTSMPNASTPSAAASGEPPTPPPYHPSARVAPNEPARGHDGPWRPVGEVGEGLAVLEGDGELVIVSLRRARAAALRRDVAASLDRGGLVSQRLLFPVVRDVTGEHAALAERVAPEATRLGFDLRRAGPRAIAVHAVPRLLTAVAPDALAELLQAHLGDLDALLDPMISRAARHPRHADPGLLQRLSSDDALVEGAVVARVDLTRIDP
ncbi:MAG TPA: DNA mismatch repair endonuclease MutL [Polyangiaceae bacterium]|nr:DNA mismatch repair endonuclease MutL [Polyangiaceae bacterium]